MSNINLKDIKNVVKDDAQEVFDFFDKKIRLISLVILIIGFAFVLIYIIKNIIDHNYFFFVSNSLILMICVISFLLVFKNKIRLGAGIALYSIYAVYISTTLYSVFVNKFDTFLLNTFFNGTLFIIMAGFLLGRGHLAIISSISIVMVAFLGYDVDSNTITTGVIIPASNMMMISLFMYYFTSLFYRLFRKLISQKRAIKQSLEEKEILLMEINHRVRNNLHLIQSLMNIQIRNTENKYVEDSLRLTQTRLLALSSIQNNIEDSNTAKVNLNTYLIEIIQNVLQYYNTEQYIDINISIYDEILIDSTKATILGFVLNDLIAGLINNGLDNTKTYNIVLNGFIENDTCKIDIRNDISSTVNGHKHTEDILRSEVLKCFLTQIQATVTVGESENQTRIHFPV